MSSTRTIDVRKAWKGMVAVRDKVVNEAKNIGDDILLRCQGKQMFIRHEEIDHHIVSRGGPYPDRFSNEQHYLYYFHFRPDDKQDRLL